MINYLSIDMIVPRLLISLLLLPKAPNYFVFGCAIYAISSSVIALIATHPRLDQDIEKCNNLALSGSSALIIGLVLSFLSYITSSLKGE